VGGREERERRPSIKSDWERPNSAGGARLDDDGNAPPRRLAPPPLAERDTPPVRAARGDTAAVDAAVSNGRLSRGDKVEVKVRSLLALLVQKCKY
jgi:hypothetical protein